MIDVSCVVQRKRNFSSSWPVMGVIVPSGWMVVMLVSSYQSEGIGLLDFAISLLFTGFSINDLFVGVTFDE